MARKTTEAKLERWREQTLSEARLLGPASTAFVERVLDGEFDEVMLEGDLQELKALLHNAIVTRRQRRLMQAGERVELIRTSDPYTRLRPGARGTVTMIDSMGTVHVRWDDGSNLGLIRGEDSWKVVSDE